MDGGLLRAGCGSVDADVRGEQLPLAVLVRALVRLDKAPGPRGTYLRCRVVLLDLERSFGLGVRVRLGDLLSEGLVEGLPQLFLERSVAVSHPGRPLLRWVPTLLQRFIQPTVAVGEAVTGALRLGLVV